MNIELTPEKVREIGQILGKAYLSWLTPEERVIGLKPEERLVGLSRTEIEEFWISLTIFKPIFNLQIRNTRKFSDISRYDNQIKC